MRSGLNQSYVPTVEQNMNITLKNYILYNL